MRSRMTHDPGQITLSENDPRLIGPRAADCAERVLPLFEAKVTPLASAPVTAFSAPRE